MQNIKIRKAVDADLTTIQALARHTIDKSYRSFLGEGVDSYINSGESDKEIVTHLAQCTVLACGGIIEAYCIYFDAFIHILMVSPEHHRSGLGSQLLAHVEQDLFNAGNDVIKLETFKDNEQAINFYIKNGWSLLREEKDESFGFVRMFLEKNAE